MKTSALCKILALASTLPLIGFAASPDDSSTSKQGIGGNKELEAGALTPAKDAIVRRTDAVYIYRDGKPMKVEERTVAAEGFTVEPGGKVLWKNGKELMLLEGQMVDFNGKLMNEPRDRDDIQGSAGARE